ncbi:MAG: type 4a pilus biogenesis protein PilO [Myxococcota bacterium]
MAMARADMSLGRLPLGAKVAVGVLMMALVGVAYYVIFYGELAGQIAGEKSREGQLTGELSDVRKAEFAFQKDLTELTERQQRQRELNKVLPTTSEYPAFLSAVQNVANVSGVALTAWAPNPEVPDKFYARIPMRVELSGRYHQIEKFFYGVGQLDRVINIENISLTDPKIVGEDLVLKAEGLATAFRALDTPGKATGDKRGDQISGGAP